MKQQDSAGQHKAAARVIIADDQEISRAGLRSMLEHERGLTVVGEACNGRAALELCQQVRPDLALLDVRMPGLDGLAATKAIKQLYPAIRVLIVTTHDNPDYIVAALRAGAAGYLLKDVTRHDLLATIRSVLRGELSLGGEMATRALQRLAFQTDYQDSPPERLTPREREVLGLIAKGHTNREIAQQLSLSIGTVKIHVEHIIAKLGVADRTQAAVRAIEAGLVLHNAS